MLEISSDTDLLIAYQCALSKPSETHYLVLTIVDHRQSYMLSIITREIQQELRKCLSSQGMSTERKSMMEMEEKQMLSLSE